MSSLYDAFTEDEAIRAVQSATSPNNRRLPPPGSQNGTGPTPFPTRRPTVKRWPAPMAEAAYYGVLGDIARGIEPYIEADSAALLVNLLVTSGIAMGRRPYLQVGAQRHYTVLNSVTVGESGDNKSDSTAPIRAILAEVRAMPPDPNGVLEQLIPIVPETFGGLSTGEGLLYQIRDEKLEKREDKQTHEKVEVVADPGVLDKRLIVMESEFARVLAVMYRDGNTLSTVLRNLFDSPDAEQVKTKNNPIIATKPHIGIVGQITPTELHRKMHDVEMVNGFAGRYLWTLTHRVKSLPDPPDYSTRAPEHAQRWYDALLKARRMRAIHRDHKALAQWAEIYEQRLRQGEGEDVDERKGMARDIAARAHTMVIRISLIFAALDGSNTITTAHQDAALAVWDYCEHCTSYLFGEVASDPVENVIADALRKKHHLRREELRALFARHVSSSAVGAALETLERAGKVRNYKEQTTGRPIEWWEWVAEATPADA